MLMNLIGNAIKFTEQGEVQVEILAEEIDGKSKLRFVVTDTGIALQNGDNERIVDEIYTLTQEKLQSYIESFKSSDINPA